MKFEIECDDCRKVIAYYCGEQDVPVYGFTCARCEQGICIGELLGYDGETL